MLGDTTSVAVVYEANNGLASSISIFLNGSKQVGTEVNLAGEILTDFNVKFIRTGSQVECFYMSSNGQYVSLGSVSNDEALAPRSQVETNGDSSLRTLATLTVRQIVINAPSALCTQSSNEVTLHGCYFLANGIGHGWSSQSLSLPLSSEGKLVYSKLTRSVSVLPKGYYINQDQEVLIGMFACNETGLDHYTPMFSGSVICTRFVASTTSEVEGSETVIGCGVTPNIDKVSKKLFWNSNGFSKKIDLASASYHFDIPAQAYRGFSDYRVLRTMEDNTIGFSFHAKET
jgi:hypothetical protein